MKKYYKFIVIGLSAIIGTFAIVLMNLFNPCAVAAFTGSITSESYQTLKDYAFEIANDPDTERKEDIVVTQKLTEEYLILKVDTSLYGVEAVFPISIYDEKIENGIIRFEGTIEYDNATYSEYTDVKSVLEYIIGSIVLVGCIMTLLYILFYYLPISIIKEKTDQKDEDSLEKS